MSVLFCLLFIMSFSGAVILHISSVNSSSRRRSRFSAPSLCLCLQPRGVWSLHIPSCHWQGWLMFRECSGGWCLLLPLHVSTWHVPSGKHIHNWLSVDYVVCQAAWLAGYLSSQISLLAEWVDILLSDWLFGRITACSGVRKQSSVIILVPDMTHMTGGSIITQRVELMADTFTPSGQTSYRSGFIYPLMSCNNLTVLYCCVSTCCFVLQRQQICFCLRLEEW